MHPAPLLRNSPSNGSQGIAKEDIRVEEQRLTLILHLVNCMERVGKVRWVAVMRDAVKMDH